MPKKKRKEKEEIVTQLQKKISMQQGAVITRMSGLSVAEVTDLRKRIREAGGEFKVTKISLLKIASRESSFEPLVKDLTGSTAVIFAYEDLVPVVKAFKGFTEKVTKLETLSGVLESKAISSSDVLYIADLPPREELLGRLAGTIVAPLSGLVGVLSAIPRGLLYALKGIQEQKENQ